MCAGWAPQQPPTMRAPPAIQSRAKIALAHAYLGELELARLELRSALSEIYEIREDDLALQSMLAEAVCRVSEGSLDAAVELASFLQHQPGSWNETKDHAGRILGTAVQSLPQAVVKAAIERGQELDYSVVVADLTGAGQTTHRHPEALKPGIPDAGDDFQI